MTLSQKTSGFNGLSNGRKSGGFLGITRKLTQGRRFLVFVTFALLRSENEDCLGLYPAGIDRDAIRFQDSNVIFFWHKEPECSSLRLLIQWAFFIGAIELFFGFVSKLFTVFRAMRYRGVARSGWTCYHTTRGKYPTSCTGRLGSPFSQAWRRVIIIIIITIIIIIIITTIIITLFMSQVYLAEH